MKTAWRLLKENPDLWKRYLVRERVLRRIRTFFEKRTFHEVETPILIPNPPAESYLDVFETTLLDRNRNPRKAYLSTSPEIPLKKLMVAGLGNCYSLTKAFRNMETQSKLHNPEFTLLEWYRVNATYLDIMEDCEELLVFINGGNSLIYQGKKIDLTPPWERITVAYAFKKYAQVDFDSFLNMDIAKKVAAEKGYTVRADTTWEELYNQIFLNEVERKLAPHKPTILYDFPSAVAALAQHKKEDPRFCERFELYIHGLELGDCYGELTDPVESVKRFDFQMKELRRLGKTLYDYDHDFIEALKVGLPQCSGIAIGVDRLVMLLANVKTIQEILLFPASELFGV